MLDILPYICIGLYKISVYIFYFFIIINTAPPQKKSCVQYCKSLLHMSIMKGLRRAQWDGRQEKTSQIWEPNVSVKTDPVRGT